MLAEIVCGSVQKQVFDGPPEVELVAASTADKAMEARTLEVPAEALLAIDVTSMRREQTAATPLVAAQSDYLVVGKVQRVANAYLLANRPVFKQAHNA